MLVKGSLLGSAFVVDFNANGHAKNFVIQEVAIALIDHSNVSIKCMHPFTPILYKRVYMIILVFLFFSKTEIVDTR